MMSAADSVLARLDAIEQIRALMHDYAYYVDVNEPDRVAELFTEDCSVIYGVDFGAEGRVAYRGLLDGIGSYFESTVHYVTSVSVEFTDASHASVRAPVFAWHRYVRDRPDSQWLGYYFNKVIKVDGAWRIRRLEMRTVGAVKHHLPPAAYLPLERG
jgi:ketosteroid isomerase-like protein